MHSPPAGGWGILHMQSTHYCLPASCRQAITQNPPYPDACRDKVPTGQALFHCSLSVRFILRSTTENGQAGNIPLFSRLGGTKRSGVKFKESKNREGEVKRFIISFLTIFLPCIVLAGITGKMSGKVIDADTGEPLIGWA